MMKYLLYTILLALLVPTISFAQKEPGQQSDTSKNHAIQYLIGVGIYNSSTKISDVDFLSGWNPSKSSYPELTFGAYMFFDKNTRDVFFMPLLSVTGTKGDFTADGGTGTPSTNNYSYKQIMISAAPMLGWNVINQKNLWFYIAAGVGFDFGLYSDVHHTVTYHISSTSSVTSALDPVAVSGMFINVATKAGLEINNHFGIYFGYIPSYNITNIDTYSVSISAYRAGLTYGL